MLVKNCYLCKIDKGIRDFRPSKRGKFGLHSYCISCEREYNRKRHAKTKEQRRHRKRELYVEVRTYVLDYLSENPCVLCGEDDYVVLEFDHVGDKSHGVAELCNERNLKAVKEEIAKCRVLCANCHKRETAKQRGYYQYYNALSNGFGSKSSKL